MHIPGLYLMLTLIDFTFGRETFEELRKSKKSNSIIENPQFGNDNQNSEMKHEEENIVETYHHIIKKILPPFHPNNIPKEATANANARKHFHDKSSSHNGPKHSRFHGNIKKKDAKLKKKFNDHHQSKKNFHAKQKMKQNHKADLKRQTNKPPDANQTELYTSEAVVNYSTSKPKKIRHVKGHAKVSDYRRHARSIDNSVVDGSFTDVDYSSDISFGDESALRNVFRDIIRQNTVSSAETNNDAANEFTNSPVDDPGMENITLKRTSRTFSQSKEQPQPLVDMKDFSQENGQVEFNEDDYINPSKMLISESFNTNELNTEIHNISESAVLANETVEISRVIRHENEKLFVFGGLPSGKIQNTTEVSETLIKDDVQKVTTTSSAILWWTGYLCVFVILVAGLILYFFCKKAKVDCPWKMELCGRSRIFQTDKEIDGKNINDFAFVPQNEESPDVEEDIQCLKQTIENIASKYQMHSSKTMEKTYLTPEHQEMIQKLPVEKDGGKDF